MKPWKLAATLLALAALPGLAALSSPMTLRYKVLLSGNVAGSQTTTIESDGQRLVEFEFHDRGRGPKLSTRLRLGAGGVPIFLETTGNDDLKNPIAERFSIEKGRASWKNRSEQGERTVAGAAFYVSLDGSLEESAALARALLSAPGGRLALLPEGEAHIEKVAEQTVHAGTQSSTVVLYAVSGLDFTPDPIWLDRDGNLFGSVSTWLTTIREGWESTVPELLEVQDAAELARGRKLAESASRRPAHPIAFRGANLFDSETATLHPGSTVVVTADRITAVGLDGSVVLPQNAEIIDASGKTLLPGLWDMHVHVGDTDGPLNIANGVTTVRDMANDIDKVAALRKHWDDGSAVGPRLITAGIVDGPGPYAGPTKALVDTPEEARSWIDRYASLGYPQIKIYSSIRPDLVPFIVTESHKRGMRVSGHVPAFMTAEEFVKDGVDEIQHINFLFLNFWFDTVKDTRTPLRFTAVAEKAADLDLDSERVRAFLRLLKERHIVSDPTVTIFENMFTARDGKISPSYASIADRMPAQIRRGFLTGGLPVPEGKDQRYRDSFRALLAMVRRLHDQGITIVAGTDGFSGFTLQRELELYVQAGIPAREVLQIATLGAARVMKRDGELGSISRGKKADLVLIDGDPIRNIGDVRRVALVVKDGIVYDPPAILRGLGIRPAP